MRGRTSFLNIFKLELRNKLKIIKEMNCSIDTEAWGLTKTNSRFRCSECAVFSNFVKHDMTLPPFNNHLSIYKINFVWKIFIFSLRIYANIGRIV